MYEPGLPPRREKTLLRRLRGFFRFLRPKKVSWTSLILGCFLAIMLVVGVGGLATVGMLAYFAKTLPDPSHLAFRSVAQSTKIYDRTGQSLLYDIHGDVRRTVIPLSDVPQNVINATIAVEDKNFYTHQGVAIKSIARAAFFNLFGTTIGRLVLRRSEGAGGASTLTQQLAKNAILTNERSLSRKLKEAFLSYRIEKRFSKDEILNLYFNEIPYGSVTYGIEAAAESFFGKHARNLDLAESALLAAVPRAPSRLSPYGNHTDELLKRWMYVLDLMVDQGMTSRADADAAKRVDILKRVKPKREAITAPHFVLYVKDLLTEQYGEDAVARGGLNVITTLDVSKQEAAEKAVSDGIANVEKSGGSNVALVALDPRTGEILALVGSRDYFDDAHDGQVNVVLRPRQPGSSMKPIVYAAAFAKGYTPNTVLFDAVTSFKTDVGKPYTPHNYDGAEHGPVTARTALAGSLNIPAVKMIYLAGISRVLDLADELGYTTLTDRSRFGLSLVLGGGEVKLLEHASAFGAFAADGIRHQPVAILKTTAADGTILYEHRSDEGRRVLDAEVARQISDILSDNAARAYIFGAQNHLTLADRPVAAKTGTTNDFHDAWAMGYVPSLVAGVWTGNNNNAEMKRGADGSKIAAPIWQQFLTDALKDAPVEGFVPPQVVITGKPILDGQPSNEVTARVDRISGKLATAYTPPGLVESRTYSVGGVHSELYYINKDDPRGPAPSNPLDDPQYQPWEEAVQRYAAARGAVGGGVSVLPPTEFDDVHLPELSPTIAVINPLEGGTWTSRATNVDVSVSSPRFPLARLEVRIDGQLVGSSEGQQTAVFITIPPTVTRGFHSLEVRAYDSVSNSGAAAVNVNLAAD